MTSLFQLSPSPKLRPLLQNFLLQKIPLLIECQWLSTLRIPGARMNQSCVSSWQKCSLCPASAWWRLTSNSWQRTFLPRGTASYVRGYLALPEREGFPLSEMDHLTPPCFISDTFSFHGFSILSSDKPMCCCLIPFEFEDGNQGNINHSFFLFKHVISLWTNKTKKPHPKPWLCFRCY